MMNIGRYKYFDMKKGSSGATGLINPAETGTRSSMSFNEFAARATRARDLLNHSSSSSTSETKSDTNTPATTTITNNSTPSLSSSLSTTASSSSSATQQQYAPIISEREQLYLYGEKMPEPLVEQFKPIKLVQDHTLTSSLLWMAISGSVSPLHFDLSEGVLAQVTGDKRFILWPPSSYSSLYPHPVNHHHDRQSRVNCVHRPDLQLFPNFNHMVRDMCLLDCI
jgi:hypothetical protein